MQDTKLTISNEQLTINNLKHHPQAIIILAVFVVLAIIYSLATPPFEAGDESRHYAVVKYMADTGRLINQNSPDIAELQHHWSHEGNQPPLYYALAAALTGWIDTDSWDETFWYNPHTTIGNPLRPDNKNITIHPPNEPWRGHVLAVYLIRFLSILMAAITVAACYAIALSLFKGNRRLAAGAMAVTAFNPMFIFISSSINNDNAVIMFVTLAVWLMTHLTISNEHFTNKKMVGYAALLGVLIGLGALSKLYAFGLLPIAGGLFIWLAYKNYQLSIVNCQLSVKPRHSSFAIHHLLHITRYALPPIAILILTFTFVSGWFYLRNALLYNGDFLALQVMRDTAGQREEIPSLATIRAEFEGFRIAYWALFGGVNILADSWIYTLLDWVSLIAIIGLTGFLIFDLRFTIFSKQSKIQNLKSKIHRPTFIILLSWCLIMLAGFIAWNITQPAGQGRLFYPSISAISALGMLGLTWWLPEKGQNFVAGLCAICLFLFAAVSPFLYIAPAYAKPPLLSQTGLPADIQPVDFTYDDTIRLIGYKLHTSTVRPAESLPVTLYWQVVRPAKLDYSIFVHVLGRQRQVVGQIDTYPGGGAWPATLLSPGDILADTYDVLIAPQTEFEHAPTRLLITAGIYDYTEPGRPGKPALNAAGDKVEPIIAAAKLVPWQWPKLSAQESSINFFDKATLLGSQIAGDQKSITFNWQANSTFNTDYTVFIQAWDTATNEYAAGFDGPPVQGDYPTSLWSPGEVIVDKHPLDLTLLEPGTYNLVAGLYNPITGNRLPAFNANGPLPDYAVPVGHLTISNE